MAGGGGLFEELGGPLVVAWRAGQALGEDQRQPVCAFAGAGVRCVLKGTQRLAVFSAIEQDDTKPCLGVGIARREPPQVPFCRREIARAIGRDGHAQRRRNIGAVAGLGVRDGARGKQRHDQRRSRRDHFVLKV